MITQNIVSARNRLAKLGGSVLANGKWVRFEAPTEGIYKIDRARLEAFGFDVSNVDPRTIRIYNNGGKVLPESLSVPRPIDLVENAILVVGESDGSFDQSDYILFYGRGSQFRDFDPPTKTIKRFNHPFSTKNYFWITAGGENGKRIQTKSSLNASQDFTQTSTTAFVDYEVDKINLAESGREFFGDNFSENQPARTYINELNNRISDFPISYIFRFVNASQGPFILSVTDNSTSIYSGTLAGYNGEDYTYGKDLYKVWRYLMEIYPIIGVF